MNAHDRACRWFGDVYGRRVTTGEISLSALTQLLEEHESDVAASVREQCAVIAEDADGGLANCYEPDIVSALIRGSK